MLLYVHKQNIIFVWGYISTVRIVVSKTNDEGSIPSTPAKTVYLL